MSLYDKLWETFSLENRPIKDLIEISALVDAGKSNPESLTGREGEIVQIASIIIALINEKSTTSVGNKLYACLSDLIVSQNLKLANANSGKQLYEKLMSKQRVGKYTIHRHRQGYRFVLKASSGEVLAISEPYSKIDTCLNGIDSVRKNSSGEIEDQTTDNYDRVSHPKFELYADKTGEFRFRLKAKNGEVIAVSEGYKNKQSCINAIESVKYNASSNCIEKA